jgi:hypothetical protein
MFIEELEKYTNCGEFTFITSDRLSQVCNAPYKYGGLYLIYANKKGISELVYIGISGRINKITGNLISRQDGLGGRIVKGKRDGEQRKDFWIREMLENQIESLRICWLVVHDEDKFQDCPEILERKLIAKYKPRWNRK